MTNNTPPKGTLKLLDSEVRQQLKEILHIPISTATGCFYTPKKDGSLGFIKFQNLVPLATMKNNIKMQQSADPVMRAMIDNDKINNTIEKYCQDLRITKPEALDEVKEQKYFLKIGTQLIGKNYIFKDRG